MNGPQGLALDSQNRLFVADTGNNRILIYPPIPPSAGSAGISAIDVIGQSDLKSQSISVLNHPGGLAFDAKKNALWVADTLNHRVLRFPLGVTVYNNNNSSIDVIVTFPSKTPDVIIAPKGCSPIGYLSSPNLRLPFLNSMSNINHGAQSRKH